MDNALGEGLIRDPSHLGVTVGSSESNTVTHFLFPMDPNSCFPSCLPKVLFLAVLFKKTAYALNKRVFDYHYFHIEVHYKNLHS